MPLTIEAVYENGVLRPVQPLPLQDREKVRIRIETPITWAEQTAGMMGWKGGAEALERLLTENEEEL